MKEKQNFRKNDMDLQNQHFNTQVSEVFEKQFKKSENGMNT